MERLSQKKYINQESKEKYRVQLGSNNLKSSFSHAIEGIVTSIFQERNLRIHFFIGFTVLLISLFLPLNENDFIWLFFAVFFVIIAELINTLIENLMDFFSAEFHPIVKIIKDISSGIVLWSAMFSVVVGVVIFGKGLFGWNLQIAKVLGLTFVAFFPVVALFLEVKRWLRNRSK
ncbi:diacylglycerol kinase family protein [Thermosipho ferrireducens]|uniref:Diacylglycerol kinase family protein n=1 Tax=Thermosipho ferrireducens TaxID=2571116 RepID=A0ABX7S542_9BACT|nr:diacylglycerol kinase family protein [Thermosipho ferrireducens]QTA37617.1 diacylglycerol kinase family protein [Thermosipho ferrireducens]